MAAPLTRRLWTRRCYLSVLESLRTMRIADAWHRAFTGEHLSPGVLDLVKR